MVTSFGTRSKISVLNPKGKVKIELTHEKKGKLDERTVVPGEDAEFLLAKIPNGFLLELIKNSTIITTNRRKTII